MKNLRTCSLALAASLVLPLGLAAQQTTPPSTNPPSTTPAPTPAPPPGTVPVTSQTPAGAGVDPTAPTTANPADATNTGQTRHKKRHKKTQPPVGDQQPPVPQ